MKLPRPLSPHPLHRGVALVVLAAVVAVVAMASSPRWHEEMHEEADQTDHECAVTLFASGNVADQVALPPLMVCVDRSWIETLWLDDGPEIFIEKVAGRIRERAPPVSAA